MENQRKRISSRREDDNISNGGSKLEDRLSSLPDHILADILSLLPLKSAVASATLSQGWRCLWTQLTVLRHDDKLSIPNFFAVADTKILPNLSMPVIHTFEYRAQNFDVPAMIHHFSSSLLQICGHGVKHIDLTFRYPYYFRPVPLPSCVFECQSLETLTLGGGLDFELPDNGIKLPNLRKLDVWVCAKDFELMINVFEYCPRLENLNVTGCFIDYQNSVSVTCPNLKRLTLKLFGFDQFQRVVINAPKLEGLYIYHDSSVYYFPKGLTSLVEAELWGSKAGGTWEPLELFQSISSSVRSLALFNDVFKDIMNMVGGVLPIFNGLTNLTGILKSSVCWEGLMCFLERCPSLQVLQIRRHHHSQQRRLNLRGLDCLPSCLSTNVKWIKLTNLDAEMHELELASFILSIAKVLETLDILVVNFGCTDKEVQLQREFHFYQELCKFPRSSPSCQINFSGQYYHASSKGMKVEHLDGYIQFST